MERSEDISCQCRPRYAGVRAAAGRWYLCGFAINVDGLQSDEGDQSRAQALDVLLHFGSSLSNGSNAAHPPDVGVVLPINLDAEPLDMSAEIFVRKEGLFVVREELAEKINLIHADVDAERSLGVEDEVCIYIELVVDAKEIQIARLLCRIWNLGGLSGKYETIDHPP